MSAVKKSTKSTVPAKKAGESKGIDAQAANNIQKILQIEQTQKDNRMIGEKISEGIAGFCGSMAFVYVHMAWFGGWVVVNLMPSFQFDPFPYTFLTLVVSLEAIFLSTFILISQNHETQVTERRNHLDLQINMLAEEESTRTLELVQAIAKKVGIDCEDESLKALLEPMDPEKMVDEIMAATEDNSKSAKPRKRKVATK